jgi:hypothetical protein
MNTESSTNHLLKFACPSIQYRVRKEILHQSISLSEMSILQAQILEDESVKEVLSWQQPDGWLAYTFHGFESMESGIRLLSEKGVESNHPVFARALIALENAGDRLELGIGKVGKILDDTGFGGSKTIQAYLFAHAGQKETAFVQEQATQAHAVFKEVLNTGSREDLYEVHNGKVVFKSGLHWPSIYHLRLLAFTSSWRTSKNKEQFIESIRHMFRLMPLPNIHIRYKSHLIAPASFSMDNFKTDIHSLTDSQWMLWFHRMELFARLGIVDRICELDEQVQALATLIKLNQGLFVKKLHHPYFKKWGSYTGLMLEKDWKHPQHRINDLTFRSILILQKATTSCIKDTNA